MITKKFIKWLVIKMRSKSTNHSPITINAERTRSKRRDLNLGPYSLLRGEKSQTYHSDFHHWLSIIKVISLLHSSLHCQFCFLALTDLLINSNFWQRAPQKSIYISAWENNAIKNNQPCQAQGIPWLFRSQKQKFRIPLTWWKIPRRWSKIVSPVFFFNRAWEPCRD